jgi:hypothetical protein
MTTMLQEDRDQKAYDDAVAEFNALVASGVEIDLETLNRFDEMGIGPGYDTI